MISKEEQTSMSELWDIRYDKIEKRLTLGGNEMHGDNHRANLSNLL